MSQIDGPLPSSFHAPSIWYAEVAVPQKNPVGNSRAAPCAAWWEDVVDTFPLRFPSEGNGWRPLRTRAGGLSCGEVTGRPYPTPRRVVGQVCGAVLTRRAGSGGQRSATPRLDAGIG